MIVRLENIRKHFEIPGRELKREVIKDISLTINTGDSIAVVGPSGSGKTTLLNIIGTLDKPSGGQVFFDDQEIQKLDGKKIAGIRNRDIGFIFQMHYLLPQLTLLENILVPVIPNNNKSEKKAALSRAMELLGKVGLGDHMKQFPGQLSGGECQRAAVVRALINQPGLILADEPTGSLDQEASEQLGDLLVGINKEFGVSLVAVTHSIQLAKMMDIDYRLENGKLIKNK